MVIQMKHRGFILVRAKSRGGRVGDTADRPVNSRRRRQTVALIDLPHLFFYCEAVRHSERGKVA